VATAGTGGGISVWIVLAAIGALATALITLGILAVNVIAHLHDRSVSGAKRPVIATKTRESWWLESSDWGDWAKEMLPGWRPADVRVVAVRLRNLSNTSNRAWFLPDEARLGWRRRRVGALFGSIELKPPPADPVLAVVFVHRSNGWGKREYGRFRFAFEIGSGEIIRFHGRLRIKTPPPSQPGSQVSSEGLSGPTS
jgi:hypothetical protein